MTEMELFLFFKKTEFSSSFNIYVVMLIATTEQIPTGNRIWSYELNWMCVENPIMPSIIIQAQWENCKNKVKILGNSWKHFMQKI